MIPDALNSIDTMEQRVCHADSRTERGRANDIYIFAQVRILPGGLFMV